MDKDAKRRERTRLNFDLNYSDKGGVERLYALAAEGKTLEDLGDYFGLTHARISQIFEALTGFKYSDYLKDQGMVNRPGPKPKEENNA